MIDFDMPAILSQFGVSLPQYVERIPRGIHGQKFFVRCNGQKFLLRVLKAENLTQLWYAYMLQHFLGQNITEVPSIIVLDENTPFLCQGKSVYIMEEFLPGGLYSDDESQIREAGRLTGRVHNMIQNFQARLSWHKEWRCRFRRLEQFIISKFRDIERNVQVSSSLSTGLRKAAQFTLQQISSIQQRLSVERISILPHWGVHHDINPTNFLYVPTRVSGICDFEGACYFPRLYDVCMAMLGFGAIQWDIDTGLEVLPFPQVINMESVRLFCSGYFIQSRLTEQELFLLPDMLKFVWIFWSQYFSVEMTIEGACHLTNIPLLLRWIDESKEQILQTASGNL